MIKGINIVSIFGQIEGVVARAMAEEGLVYLIEPELIPPTVRWNELGQQAECAVMFAGKTEAIFDKRVRGLRQ